MRLKLLVLIIYINAIITTGYRLFIQKTHSIIKMSSNLDGELNKFFENVSRTGSSKFKKMPPEERLEYAIKGEALENEIYDIRDQINDMESTVFDGASIDLDLIKKLRYKLSSLKKEYIDLIGSNDLPIYFGKNNDSGQIPDSLQ